jgi:hypothetical protein
MSLCRDPHVPGFNTGIELDVSHVPGAENIIADDLSRWNFLLPYPMIFNQAKEFNFHLPDSKLLWKLPLLFAE